jgi:predicted Zn-dependent peptidase
MIEFKEFSLDNGLQVIVHQDSSTPIVAFNIVYNVGARDENEDKTGFAHLFEHLMFGGSENIESYDSPLQLVGGENNAFTSNDITNYYITLPKDSIETAFWLESDRMLSLAFSENSLEVQRKVVIEEFNQRYLNQPYGDAFLHLRPLAYKKHPYKWATIGKEIAHIENATLKDVKEFFFKFYRPNNAILAIAGDVNLEDVKRMTKKWFGEIPKGVVNKNEYEKELIQTKARRNIIESDVPLDAIYVGFHMPNRLHKDYQAVDLLSDILSRGSSSIFYQNLVKEQKLFSDISSYITGDFDEGLLMISGKLNEGVSLESAENAIWEILSKVKLSSPSLIDLEKVKNKIISSYEYANTSILNKAMSLAISKLMGNPDMVNLEVELYNQVSEKDILRVANKVLLKQNSSTLIYKTNKN